MNLIIRPAVLSDVEIIMAFNLALALESENLKLDPAVVRLGVAAALRDPAKAVYFLAELDGKVVGQLMVTHEWSDWRNGTWWWIQSVFVDKNFRSRGVFKAMYRHVQETARTRKDVCGFRLYMEEHNAARKVYEGLGMKQTYYNVFEQMLSADGK